MFRVMYLIKNDVTGSIHNKEIQGAELSVFEKSTDIDIIQITRL